MESKIFDPFFSTKFAGRGMGLAVIKGIIHSHKKLPGAPLKVSDSRYPIDYATAAPFAIGFLDPPMLAIEEMNMGISRWPITLRN